MAGRSPARSGASLGSPACESKPILGYLTNIYTYYTLKYHTYELMNMYVKPEEVVSPKTRWQLIAVLLDRGGDDCSYALGKWDGNPCIGFRWNGTDDNPLGNPQSRGLATWVILDPNLHHAVLSLVSSDMRVLARRILPTSLHFQVNLQGEGADAVVGLWDTRPQPAVAAKIDCATIRALIKNSSISNDDCRLLMQDENNKDLVTEIAEGMLSNGLFTEKRDMKIIEIGEKELKPIATRLSTSVLELRPKWIG